MDVKLTPSKAEDFEACPLRFKLVHLDHLGPKERRPSPHLALGTTIHECLYRFHEGGGYTRYSADQVEQLVGESWVAQGYSDAQEELAYRAEATRMARAYHQEYRDEPVQNLGNELFLQSKFRVGTSGLVVSGKIDRLSAWPDGHLEVVDYKTTNGPIPSPQKLAMTLGVVLYYALAKANYATYSQVDVSYIFLRPMAKVTVSYDRAQLIRAKARLLQVVRQIEDGSFPPKPNGHCGWCEVKAQCPAMRQEEMDLAQVLG